MIGSSSTGEAGALSGDTSAEAGRAIGLGATAPQGSAAADTGAGASPPIDALAGGALERTAARSLGSRYASALLLTALALSVLLGVLARRTGALGRLRLLVQRVGADEPVSASGMTSSEVTWGTTPAEGGEHVR